MLKMARSWSTRNGTAQVVDHTDHHSAFHIPQPSATCAISHQLHSERSSLTPQRPDLQTLRRGSSDADGVRGSIGRSKSRWHFLEIGPGALLPQETKNKADGNSLSRNGRTRERSIAAPLAIASRGQHSQVGHDAKAHWKQGRPE